MPTATEIMERWSAAQPGTRALFRSSDSRGDVFELHVTDHQATWFFHRATFNFLRPDIEAAGVSYCVWD